MKLLDLFRGSATKATTSAGPDYYSASEQAYWTDWFRNGWAAVSSAWGALVTALRQWGPTDYAGLAADASANAHAGRGLRLICDNGAAVKVIAYQEATRDGDEDEADPQNEALQAIHRTGWGELWTAFVWGIYCGGEVFLRRLDVDNGQRTHRIQILRNERLHAIKYNRDGEPSEYQFAKRGSSGGYDPYPADEVLHIKMFNPENEDRGLPLLVAARRALTLVAEADAWNRSIAKGGGVIPGFITPTEKLLEQFNGQLPEAAVKQIQDKVDQRYATQQSKSSPYVLSGATRFERSGVSPREADWLKGRNVAMREVAAVMGVPPALLADEKGGSLTDAGVDSEVAALYKLTIQPLMHRLLHELTAWLCEDGTRLDADWDQVPALQEDIDAKFLRYGGVEVLSEKERRVALGYDPEIKPEMQDEEPLAAPEAPDPFEEEEQPDESEAVKALRDLPASFWDRFDPETLAA